MTYFFTADEHYGHAKIIGYNDRPFDSVEEMDEALIANHNEVVSKQDVVVHAGDFCWLNRKEDVYKKYVSRLNGTHMLLIGSHDHWQPSSARYIWRKRIENNLIMVCHYAMRTWECSHYNSWHLYGHSHGLLSPIGKAYDIGVDNNNYYPVSFEQIKTIMNERPDNFNYKADERAQQL
jgi:calcineurin-like phosphoesterase family protein